MVYSNGGYKVSLSKSKEFPPLRFPRLLPPEHQEQLRRHLARAANNLRNSNLSASQINQILGSLKIFGRVVSLRLYSVDLSNVPIDLLPSLVTSCRDLNISETNLTTSQISAIFQAIQRSGTLQELEMQEKHLKDVPTHEKTACIVALKSVTLDDGSDDDKAKRTEEATLFEDCLGSVLLKGK